jgi:hypothetical protein
MKTLVALFSLLLLSLSSSERPDKYFFKKANVSPVIDGKADDAIWGNTNWLPINQVWLGETPSKDDFSGKFKVTWDENYLYVLAEITDDILIDSHDDALSQYWDDDCLEIFLDEDASGGEHTNSFNAFAYHIALNNDVVDYSPKGPEFFNDHVKTMRLKNGTTYIWETRISLYDDSYDTSKENKPVKLFSGKKIGFAIAYCDNDKSEFREHFVGSEFVPGDDKNRGYIDAGIFGIAVLR